MPEPAAELILYCYEVSKNRSEAAREILREYDFHPSKADGSVIEMEEYIAYHFQPFENQEENVEILDECVRELEIEFPEMEVWLKQKTNKDYGSRISEDYLLYIAPDRETVASSRTIKSTNSESSNSMDSVSNPNDWRAKFDDE